MKCCRKCFLEAARSERLVLAGCSGPPEAAGTRSVPTSSKELRELQSTAENENWTKLCSKLIELAGAVGGERTRAAAKVDTRVRRFLNDFGGIRNFFSEKMQFMDHIKAVAS